MILLKSIIKEFEKNKKISFIIFLLILITMTYCSSIPGNKIQTDLSLLSIIYHFSIFAIFTLFFMITISKGKSFTIFVSFLVAVLDEFHQYFVPFRNAGIEDILIDLNGVIFAIILYLIIKKSK